MICTDREAQLRDDIATLCQIVEGLDRLEQSMDAAREAMSPILRGYFTPVEEDGVRQMLLAYRNYRIAIYEIIDRCRDYESLADLPDQLRTFIVGYAAALTIYTKSNKLIEACRKAPLIRQKLNEPEADFGLEANFFETILERYTSFKNYATLVHAERFWRRHRRDVRRLGVEQEPEFKELVELIQLRRVIVRRTFRQVVRERVVQRTRMLREHLTKPADDARYALRAFALGALGSMHVPVAPPCFDEAILGQIHPRMRPGDVLLMRTERKLTSALLPGFWIHSAVYLGGFEDLERMEIANGPELRRHWNELHTGQRYGCVVHAFSPGVVIWPLERVLQVDHLAVLRPQIGEADRTNAILESVRHLGKPYDFEFDFNQCHRLVCTSLIYRCFQGRGQINFSLVKHLGRFALTCDELCAQAVAGISRNGDSGPFLLKLLVLQTADGRPHVIPDAQALTHLQAILKGTKPSRDLRM